MGVVVRTRDNPQVTAERLRAILGAIDDGLAPREVMPLSSYVADVNTLLVLAAMVILSLASIAALIAFVGVYAVVVHYVGTRSREIGIRIPPYRLRGPALR